jgi:L-fucose isomerase-like protein
MKKTTFGVIIGNRGFFPRELCRDGRNAALNVLKKEGYDSVVLSAKDSPFGSIESLAEAHKCADLFKRNRANIDGVIVFLPNFGDERAIANALRFADLKVPVLLQAFPDEAGKMTIQYRRDSFCGKMSAASNLRQYGIPYTLTSQHTSAPDSKSFIEDLHRFAATCRIVRGFHGARVGAIGARPGAFNTVRYSEKLLEKAGISVEVVDLFEIMGQVNKLKDGEPAVRKKLTQIKGYLRHEGISEEGLVKMARFAAVVERWMKEKELIANSIQCWTAIEEFFGVVPCAVMSMFSNELIPSACEVDITGMLGMMALQFATGRPSALVDWNNNYGNDPDKCVLFHCSNLPKAIFSDAHMGYQQIISGAVGKENTYGTVEGRIAPGDMSFCRVSTDDVRGRIVSYVGDGKFTNDKLQTFGGFGVMEVQKLQKLLRYACLNGFEHHVAINRGHVAGAIAEAFNTYLKWNCRYHNSPEAECCCGQCCEDCCCH